MPWSIPIGAILVGWCVLMAVRPIRRPRRVALASWIASASFNELPVFFCAIVAVSTLPAVLAGDVSSAGDWASLALSVLTVAGLVVVARRALAAGPVVDRALDDALPGWRTARAAGPGRRRRRLPPVGALLFPWPARPREVERVRDVAYGEGGASNRLDVYRHRTHPPAAPTFIHFHGGGFRRGRKSWEARPLLHQLARHGWTCISANYQLASSPSEGFPQHLIDAKRVIAWARAHARDHGIDPGTIVVGGSSAGAHLTLMAALSANDPRFQPGFEGADTSITAGVGLYGYYGPVSADRHLPSTPLDLVGPHAPPLMIVHGDHDTSTPVEGARELVDRLRASSSQPVVYAELPGAQHSFDVFPSIRFTAVVDAVESFADAVRAGPPQSDDATGQERQRR